MKAYIQPEAGGARDSSGARITSSLSSKPVPLGITQHRRTVIRSIVELGHGLGLRCTAEGVETLEALEYVAEVGCDLAQGYHIAQPMPGEDALAWMTEPRM